MTKRQKFIEGIHILSTMDAIGRPALAGEIRERANEECCVGADHPLVDEVDTLPFVAPQGITPKLNALSLAGLVTGDQQADGIAWELTDKGRCVARDAPGAAA